MASSILLALAPVFFVMLAGFAAGRWRVVENHEVASLNTFVMTFALPAALLSSTAAATREQILGEAPLFAVLCLVMLAIYLGWYVGVRLVSPTSRADAALQALTIAFPNLAGVALPIASCVIGPGGTVPVAIALAVGSLTVSPLSLIVVELSQRSAQVAAGSSPWRRIAAAVMHSVTKPVVLAPALGILLAIADLQPPPFVDASLMLIGHAAPGVALFLTGLVLSAQPFRLNWKVVWATAIADMIRPLTAAAIVLGLPISPEIAKVAVLLSAVPSGFFGILFAVTYRLEAANVGSMVIASTLFSIPTMALAIAFLFP